MKPFYIPILLLCCLVVSTALYTQKYKAIEHADYFGNSLKGVTKYLSKGASIGFAGEQGNAEILTLARYQLAPLYVSPEADKDTVLSIQYITKGDSVLNNYVAGRTTIWQGRDTQYVYSLTVPYAN